MAGRAGLLVEAYAAAGRTARPSRGSKERSDEDPQLYRRSPTSTARARWSERRRRVRAGDCADAVGRNTDLRSRYASMLLKSAAATRSTKARDTLTAGCAVCRSRGKATRHRRARAVSAVAGRAAAGDSTPPKPRRGALIAQNSRTPRGYYALAEALEERRSIRRSWTRSSRRCRNSVRARQATRPIEPHAAAASRLCLPAARPVRQGDRDLRGGAQARAERSGVTGYLIQANSPRSDSAPPPSSRAPPRRASRRSPAARLEAQALRQSGKADQGDRAARGTLARQAATIPTVTSRSRNVYSRPIAARRRSRCCRTRRRSFPPTTPSRSSSAPSSRSRRSIADAEGVFRQLIAREPDHAAALNYLGYMLAERGERLDESVELHEARARSSSRTTARISTAWAGRTSRLASSISAEEHLQRAADQLNDELRRPGSLRRRARQARRFDDAIAAWTRALAGDGDSIDRGDIDKKIRAAKQKLPGNEVPRRRSCCSPALTASCGAPLMKLPSAPARRPRDDAAALLADATAACRGIHRSPRRSASADRSAASAPRPSARRRSPPPRRHVSKPCAVRPADLHLRGARRRRHAAAAARQPRARARPPADVLEAVTGVPLDAADLRHDADRLRAGGVGRCKADASATTGA